MRIIRIDIGGMAEWFKAAVLKTAEGLKSPPGVRIPLPPLRRDGRVWLKALAC